MGTFTEMVYRCKDCNDTDKCKDCAYNEVHHNDNNRRVKTMKTKTFKYHITFKDGREIDEEFEADNVLDGHYRIYRKYGRTYAKAYYIK